MTTSLVTPNMLIHQEIEHIAIDGRDKTEQRLLKSVADLRALGAPQATIDRLLVFTITDAVEMASEIKAVLTRYEIASKLRSI